MCVWGGGGGSWFLGSHFGTLIDLELDMAGWLLMLRSGTLTSVITSGLFVYRWSINVADVCVVLVGDLTSWIKPSSVPRKDGAGIWRLGAELSAWLCVYLVPVVCASGLCAQI